MQIYYNILSFCIKNNNTFWIRNNDLFKLLVNLHLAILQFYYFCKQLSFAFNKYFKRHKLYTLFYNEWPCKVSYWYIFLALCVCVCCVLQKNSSHCSVWYYFFLTGENSFANNFSLSKSFTMWGYIKKLWLINVFFWSFVVCFGILLTFKRQSLFVFRNLSD